MGLTSNLGVCSDPRQLVNQEVPLSPLAPLTQQLSGLEGQLNAILVLSGQIADLIRGPVPEPAITKAEQTRCCLQEQAQHLSALASRANIRLDEALSGLES